MWMIINHKSSITLERSVKNYKWEGFNQFTTGITVALGSAVITQSLCTISYSSEHHHKNKHINQESTLEMKSR